ncbi:hypothetical protein FJO69_01300 [[Mycoplasma] falconis]|uniref:Uncharacterized protein n=1 Tax=[Mycoplasma] falconis TaxID=92403 RepID=A0A501XAJ7_9BACT|nr:hypothetical protein [[Mycoplasma] falconis]TPE57551.1 hypothetical protein FJO69_01300 [[Mycoplasma] falconis]
MTNKNIILGALNVTPLFIVPAFVVSAKQEDNVEKTKMERIMASEYSLFDFIKLTGRYDTEINLILDCYLKDKDNKEQVNYIVFYKNKDNENIGYSIFWKEKRKVIEVNPNYDYSWIYNVVYQNERNKELYKSNKISLMRDDKGEFKFLDTTLRGRPIGGDHKVSPWHPSHPDQKWKNYYKKTSYSEDVDSYQHFFHIHLKDLKAKKNKSIFKVRNEKLGLIYADNEVDSSWFFKVANEKDLTKNDFALYKPEEAFLNPALSLQGICGYNTFARLIFYNEFFKSSNYLLKEDFKYITKQKNFLINFDLKKSNKIQQVKNFFESLSLLEKQYYLTNLMLPHINNNFISDIMDKYKKYPGTPYNSTVELSDVFLEDNKKLGKLNYSSYVFDNSRKNYWYYLAKLKQPIELVSKVRTDYSAFSNFSKSYHSYIAYGLYNDWRLLVNYNWGQQYNQVIIDPYFIKENYVIENKSNNKLNNYFWNGVNFVDGKSFTKTLKDEWGLIK